jgi:flagellar protein FlaJ
MVYSIYPPMDEYKKSRMPNILKVAGIGMTPEVYAAYAIAKAGTISLASFPVCSSIIQVVKLLG